MKIVSIVRFNPMTILFSVISLLSIIALGTFVESGQYIGAGISGAVLVGGLIGVIIIIRTFLHKMAMYKKYQVDGFVMTQERYGDHQYRVVVSYEYEGVEYRITRTLPRATCRNLAILEGELVRVGVNKYNPKQAIILDLYE
ncbi:hypothetical protein [Candidatus Xianfuyuplasma coldseepsis]|uniref:Uncharacterized protein n=1 Tax=Candidatus Xianfuyuplasma coldseepsis TaxID=2782163 RepID=A0A7L7KUM3_9MOLU|nr:hypothetical protein [Xianfuyuplasma coldseepsis]QMS85478.1 hypothetical protein G4Z02_06895 [Xianfuyuplasma coldseepsis]